MSRRQALLWSLVLAGWWLGVIFGRISEEMDLSWWDTLFLFLVGGLTFWVISKVQGNVTEHEEPAP